MPRGGKRTGAGRPAIPNETRLEIGRRACEIYRGLQENRLLLSSRVGSVNERKHLRTYIKEIEKLKSNKYRLAGYELDYHKDDIEFARQHDQKSFLENEQKSSKWARVTPPRNYANREGDLEEIARILTAEFRFPIKSRLVADSMRRWKASQSPVNESEPTGTFEWSEPASVDDEHSEDGVCLWVNGRLVKTR